jgi:hypothetical protein
MIGLLLATVAVWGPPPTAPAARSADLRELPAACEQGRVLAGERAQDVRRATKLGDLPKAHLMLPVLRTVEGCAVPTIVRYDVEQDGRFAKPAK